jgi:hypothetical protein
MTLRRMMLRTVQLTLVVLVCAGLLGWQAAVADTSAPLPIVQERGEDLSITILPVVLAGKPMSEVGTAVGLFLDRGGLKHIEVSDAKYVPDPGTSLASVAAGLKGTLSEVAIETDLVLWAAFDGQVPSPGTPPRVDAVRAVLTDSKGAPLWMDEQTPEDAAFQKIKPTNPMLCCVLLSKRLQGPLGIADPMSPTAEPGPFAKRYQEQIGAATDEEREAIDQRQAEFLERDGKATILVLPIKVGNAYDAAAAKKLADLLKDGGLGKARASSQTVEAKIPGGPNQQRRMWLVARFLQGHVREHAPKEDYVLFVECFLDLEDAELQGMQMAMVSKAGDVVLVDLANDHQSDVSSLTARSVDDVLDLMVSRLSSELK